MRAVRVVETGGPDVLRVEEVPEPEPGAGQVRIRVAASGVNFIDAYHRSGGLPRELPFTLGVEAAGTVDAVGPGVTSVAEGDRVAYAMQPGSHAEAAVVDAERVVAVPDELDLEVAAASMVQGITAHYLTTSTFPLVEGQRVLIHAAAGGLGLLLVQAVKRLGATVYGTVSTEEKAKLARQAGADEVIRYTEVPFAEEIDRLTGGEGVDVVYDSVARDTFDGSLSCLRSRGYLVVCGYSSGRPEPVDVHRLNVGGSLFLTRPNLADYIATREELVARASDVLGWVAAGELDVRIGERYPLEDAATAYRRLEGRETAGKVLLIP